MRVVIFPLLMFLFGEHELQKSKKLEYIDKSYEEEIKTVQLYPYTGNPQDVFDSPAVPIDQNTLVLEFDDLVESHEDYRAMLIHCNADWTASKLKPLDYLTTYNEFIINQFEYSVDTKIGYVHYTFKVPNVKVSGNYLIVAYRGTNTKDIILSKRFMVYQRSVGIAVTSNRIGLTSIDRRRQKIDFDVS
ncbi:MAG: type IX secretion system plug protein domain-containing protein, partial [Bacteroidota bacterium]